MIKVVLVLNDYTDGSTKIITEPLELKYYYYEQLKELLVSEGLNIKKDIRENIFKLAVECCIGF